MTYEDLLYNHLAREKRFTESHNRAISNFNSVKESKTRYEKMKENREPRLFTKK